MPEFAYRAGAERGTVAAGSPREARDRLRERGLAVSEVRELTRRRGAAGAAPAGRLRGRRGFDLAEVARELATLLSVGVPVLEALETLAAGRAAGPRAVLETLAERLRRGVPLAAAMRDPAVARHFDPLSVQLVEVGEQAGNLDEALDRVAEFRERRAQLQGKLGATLAYPLFVGVVAVLVSVFLMTRVVPGVLAPLLAQGRPLPAVTLAVKAVSDTLLHQGGWILLGLLVAGALGVLAWRRPAVRRAASEASLRVPVLGPLLRQRALCHLCEVMGTLLRAGIDFDRACALAARSCPQRVIGEALGSARESVVAGSDIAEALEATGHFPPTVVRAFAVGQRSGRLGPVLQRLADNLDAQVQRGTARLGAVLEPALIVAVAVLVGVIAYATLIPILEASDAF